jgi:hypothetical protein
MGEGQQRLRVRVLETKEKSCKSFRSKRGFGDGAQRTIQIHISSLRRLFCVCAPQSAGLCCCIANLDLLIEALSDVLSVCCPPHITAICDLLAHDHTNFDIVRLISHLPCWQCRSTSLSTPEVGSLAPLPSKQPAGPTLEDIGREFPRKLV